MRARVRQEVRDTNSEMFTDASIDDYLNEAQEDLANRLMVVTTSTTGTTSGNTISTAQTGLIKVRSLRLGSDTDKDDVEFVDDDVFFTWMDSGDDPGHTIAILTGGNIMLYPTPDTGTAWTMYFFKKPADLSAGGDESGLPAEFHPRMVYYATARCFYKQREFDAADRFMAMYERAVPEQTLTDRQNPGPINIYPQQGPFDRSDYLS